MRIFELISGEPTPEPIQPLGPQNPVPQGSSLPQPAPMKAAVPADAPAIPSRTAKMAHLPTVYMPIGSSDDTTTTDEKV